MRFCSSTSGLLKLVSETSRFRSSRIYESTRDLRGQATKIIAWRGYEYPLKERYLQTAGNNWNIIHFACPVDKWSTHPFDSRRRTKLSFVAQWDSGKRSSSTEVNISSNILSGTTSMSKSRNMACLYVPWSRANVIVSAAYKQFSSLVERGKMSCENLQRPLGSYN